MGLRSWWQCKRAELVEQERRAQVRRDERWTATVHWVDATRLPYTRFFGSRPFAYDWIPGEVLAREWATECSSHGVWTGEFRYPASAVSYVTVRRANE